MLPQPAPADLSASPICAKTPLHCASKSAPGASIPAMKRYSAALTRVTCEYWPSGLPRASTFVILMSAIVFPWWFRLVARRELRSDRRDQLGAAYRLHVIGVPTRGHAAVQGGLVRHHRADDHGGRGVRRSSADRGEHADAADARHQEIEQALRLAGNYAYDAILTRWRGVSAFSCARA